MLTLQKAKEVSAGISDLVELNVKEVSGVDDPAVPLAHFLIIKRDNNGKVKLELTQKDQPMALSYRNLPVSKDRSWDGAAAKASLQVWAKSEGDIDFGKFAQGFLIRDGASENITSYKFPIAKVVGGKLAVPFGALVAAAAALKGGRNELAGGANLISTSIRRRAFSNVQKYYRKLNVPKEDIPEFTAKLFIKFNQSDQLGKGDKIMALTLTKDLADELKTQLTDISNMLEDGEAKEALISVVDNIVIEKEAQSDQSNDKSITKSQEEVLADIKKDIDTITAKLAELSKESTTSTSDKTETNGNNEQPGNDEAWKAMLTELGSMIEQGKLTAEELGQLGSLLTT